MDFPGFWLAPRMSLINRQWLIHDRAIELDGENYCVRRARQRPEAARRHSGNHGNCRVRSVLAEWLGGGRGSGSLDE
jgi:hypothetical protein